MSSSSAAPTCQPVGSRTDKLPPYRVLLHNDDVNSAEFVTTKVQEIAHLKEEEAVEKVVEAHEEGVALLLATHKERAELLVEMFTSCKITVTMEKE